MGNSPSTDLGGAELHGREIEAMDTKGEKSSEVNKLAGTKSKSKDDESSIPKPLQSTIATEVQEWDNISL